MLHESPFPWPTYLQTMHPLNDWERVLFDQLSYQSTLEDDQRCNLIADIILRARQRGLATETFDATTGDDPVDFGATLVARQCAEPDVVKPAEDAGHALLDGVAAPKDDPADKTTARLIALHTMIRCCQTRASLSDLTTSG